MATNLKAPFPAFGGKSRVSGIVWNRFGDVRNYIEPFCFSAAMLLNRPHPGKIETINDRNYFVSNFWRAVQKDPESVAEYADWPVNECDLHARHNWLVNSPESQEKLLRVRREPDYFDAKIAGWWCWGACCWIGSGWCPESPEQLPHMTGAQGVNRVPEQLPHMDAGRGVLDALGSSKLSTKIPILRGGCGQGINGNGRPQLADQFSRGRGVNGNDSASVCADRREWLIGWMFALADRLRPVRVCCGHWNRVCDSPSTLTRLGLTAVFLDPPYRKKIEGKKNRAADIYANDATQDIDALCDEVQGWCLKWGDDPEIRIALCGLEGEYPLLDHWECHAWKSNGGYGNQSGEVNANAARERIWFSPHCLAEGGDRQQELFGEVQP